MTENTLKVLFLTRYPQEGASSRYRVYQYVPHLEALGISCEVQSFMDRDLYHLSMRSGNTLKKIAATLRACLRRLEALFKWRRYDIIYMQRELFPFGPPLVERWLKRRGAVMLFDYDDALFIKKASTFSAIATFFRSPQKTLEVFRLVDCVVAGNNWLRDAAIEHGGHAVTVEVAEDTNRIPLTTEHSNEKPLTIGWLGSPSTAKYLRLIEDALEEIAATHPNVQFEIVGGGDFTMPGIPFTLTPWSMDGELEALARFDIGLMPLPMEEWSRGKSGGKARAYMAAGVVPVCTAIGYNLELIRHGETGFLCESATDWKENLTRLIGDCELRQSVAIAARKDVEERFSPQRQAIVLRDLFNSVLETRRGTA